MNIADALSNLFGTPAYADTTEAYYPIASERTKQFEGFESKPYDDTDMETGEKQKAIGYGFTYKTYPNMPQEMTRSKADEMFKPIYAQADKRAMDFAGDAWKRMTDGQKAVTSDMAYNLRGRLSGFKDMRAALQAGDMNKAADEIVDSNYYGQVGNRSKANVDLWRKDIRGSLNQTDVKNKWLKFGAGNIDLTKRPVVKNKDGSFSTVRSVGVEVDGKHVLLPVSDDGKNLTVAQAVQQYKRTGKSLGVFDSEKESTDYAKKLHLEQEAMVSKRKLDTHKSFGAAFTEARRLGKKTFMFDRLDGKGLRMFTTEIK